MSIDEALLALVREVRRVGAGEAVFRGHVSAHSWGGSVRQPSGGPHPEDGVDLSLLPALLGALPGPPRRCAVELQARADDRWQATLCWADDWDSFITPRRVLREIVEPAVPAAPEIPPVDDDLLAKRWAQVREQHDPRPPATPTEIGATEALLGRSLPQPVRALYAVSDGARRRLRMMMIHLACSAGTTGCRLLSCAPAGAVTGSSVGTRCPRSPAFGSSGRE